MPNHSYHKCIPNTTSVSEAHQRQSTFVSEFKKLMALKRPAETKAECLLY